MARKRPGNVFTGNVLSGKRLPGKVVVRETNKTTLLSRVLTSSPVSHRLHAADDKCYDAQLR